MSRGPAKSGFNPSKEHYRCPLQNCFGKILLDKIYKCVSFENFNKLFSYWKINRQFFSPPHEFCNFYDGVGSVLDS